MNQLTKFLLDNILLEAKIEKEIVVYSGRFQPFHAGHNAVYQHLASKFGSDNVYIATSDIKNNTDSPFGFREKKAIMTTLFGIPSSKIVKVKNPYAPDEILGKYNKKKTALITAVGEKDKGRLKGNYFKPYKPNDEKEGYEDKGYVYIIPPQAGGISGTKIRAGLSTGADKEKRAFFKKVYPKFDEQIYKLITLTLKKINRESVNESLLTEGGAYGHMAHPFDIEMNLTFGDLKNIVKNALNGKLQLTTEKLDGQAIAVSWVNGRLVAARNKGHLANKGKNAMDLQSVISKFAGRGAVSEAFSFAMKDLQSAISGLSQKQKDKIFKNGKCFMNCEIIYPANSNVIPYGQATLLFHGTMEYDESGTAIGENKESASILAGMIKQINANVQSKFAIQGPASLSLPKNTDLKSKQGQYLSKITKLQSEFGLKDSEGVADYHQAWWQNYVNKKSPKGLTNLEKIGLVKRWAFDDKTFGIRSISDKKAKEWADKTDKENLKKIQKDNISKFEEIFLGVGAEVLSYLSSALVVNPDAAKQSLVSSLESAISQIRLSKNPTAISKLETELAKIEALGGFEKIVPIEGLTFSYKGNTYKLTGAFAPLNQILGIFKYGR